MLLEAALFENRKVDCCCLNGRQAAQAVKLFFSQAVLERYIWSSLKRVNMSHGRDSEDQIWKVPLAFLNILLLEGHLTAQQESITSFSSS